MQNIDTLLGVARSGLSCLLLVAFYPGHWVVPTSAAQEPSPRTGANTKIVGTDQNHQPDTTNVPPDAAVITINGLCDNPPTDKAEDSNCKTVITRSEFEKIIGAVQPDMKVRAQREFAERYATALVMARKAVELGLSKGSNFEEQMHVARIQILSQELKKTIEREASQISDTDVGKYYHQNLASFEEAELERIYVPRTPDSRAPVDGTLTNTDKLKEVQDNEQAMRDLAGKLRSRAIRGEEFGILQAEACKIAGIKTTTSPSVTIRRISLPPNQVWVMNLNAGEVSSVIDAPNGFLVYKIKTKETLPLDKVREEIKGVLRSQRREEKMQEIEESAAPTLNETFFRSQKAAQK